MLNVDIFDNNQKDLTYYSGMVRQLCKTHDMAANVKEFSSVDRFRFDIDNPDESIDIVLLSIAPPEADGIRIGEQLRANGYRGSIIYITYKDDYMLPAFDVRAFNYVLKSEEGRQRFNRIFLQAVELVEKRTRSCLLLNGLSEHRSIFIDDISYFEVRGHLICVHYGKDEAFEFISTLGRVENMLLGQGFARIHRSYLVQCSFVKSFTYRMVTLWDGTEIPIGRKYAASFKETMEAHSIAEGGDSKEDE